MSINPETRNPSGKKHPHKGGKKYHPPKGVGGAIGGAGGAAAHAAGGSKHNVKKNKRKVRRIKKRNDKREERQYNRASQKSYLKYRKEEAKQVKQDLKQSDVESFNRATERAQRKSEKPVTKLHLSPNELDAMAWILPVPGLKGPLAKPVIKIAEKFGIKGAERGAVKETERIAEGKLAKKEAERAAAKRESGQAVEKKTAGKAAGKKADKKITKEARAKAKSERPPVKSRVKSRAGKFAKKHRPTVTAGKLAMKGAANERVRKTVIAGGIAGPVVAGPGAAVVQNTVEAAKDDPGKFVGTSTSALGSLATAPIALAGAGYSTAKNLAEGKSDPFAPAAAQIEAYKDYLKDYPELANPGSEKARRLIENKYGITPVVTGALGVHAATRLVHGVASPHLPESKPHTEPKVVRQGVRLRRTSKVREEAANSPSAEKANAAARALRRAEKGKHRRRVDTATELDNAGHRARAAFDADMTEKATVSGKTKTFNKSMKDLSQVPLGREGYTAADAVQLVHSYGVPLDATAGKAALIEIRDSLRDPKVAREIPGSVRDTRTILDALIENPQILEHSDFKRTEIQLRAIREDQANAPASPDPRDRARHVAQAREHGVATPEERVPHELRGKVKVKVKKYEDSYRRLRQRANQLVKHAKDNERIAKRIEKTDPKKAAELAKRAGEQRMRAEEIRAVVNRPQQAKRFDAEAYKARQAGDEAAAVEAEGNALRLRQEHRAAQDRLDTEFHGEMDAARQAAGQREPIFFHDLRADDVGEPVRGGHPVNAAAAASADKVKLGKLREQGLVDESGTSLIESIYRDRANVEMNSALKRILGDERKGRLLTGIEARNMVAAGKFPAGHSLIPLQDFKRAYARGQGDAALGILEEAKGVKDMRKLIVEADFQSKGKKYAMIPTSVLDEAYAQAQGIGKFAKGLKAFGAAQSLVLLGTSPTWAFYQGFATPLTLAARHPNPVTWVKAARDMARLYKRFTPRERAAFATQYGGNVGEIVGHMKFDELKPGFDQIRSLSDASKVVRATWAGKLLNSISKGGPLIQGVAKWEAMLRTAEALGEIDKLHGRTHLTRWVNDLADLDALTRKQIDEVKGMSFEERVRYFSDPQNTKPIERRVTSTLGNWTALTAREKRWSGAFMFYPFLRFSLKWAFHTFPKDNPVKAAILLNLAQQNSQEVKDMLGGTPSFIQSFGMIPYRNQEGDVAGAINMARAAPASNALTEQIGGAAIEGQTLNLSMLGRVVQPALAAMILQGVGGLDPFTGQSVGGTIQENMATAVKQIVGLSPIGRAWGVPFLEENVDSLKPSPTAEYFRDLIGRGPVSKAFDPIAGLTTTKSMQRANQQAGEILDKAGSAPTDEEIADIASKYEGMNKAEIASQPEVQDLLRRARSADKAQKVWQDVLKTAGFASTDSENETFGDLKTLLAPIGGFGGSPIDRRTEAQRVRFLKKNKGLTGKQIQEQYPTLPTAYASRIEALRRSGMTDEQIAAKYPYLRKHLSSLNGGSSGWGSSGWGSGSSWGSDSGWGSGSSWGK